MVVDEQAQEELQNRELLDTAVSLRWEIERLEAAFLGHIAQIDRRTAFREDGAVSTTAWLKNQCRMDGSRAGQLVRLARAGEEFPDLRDAQLDGRISGCEARRIVHGADTYRHDLNRRTADQHGADESVEEFQRSLLTTAENGEGTGELRRQIDSHRHELAAQSMVIDEWAAFQQRELYLYTTFDGMINVRGTLDPVSAAQVKSALESLAKPKGDERSTPQRRADALIQLSRNALDGGHLPTTGGQKPHVHVAVSEETLKARNAENGTEPAHLNGHGAVSGETARMLACDAEVTRLVYGTDSEILDLGRAAYAVPPALHKALRLRDQGCTYPNCDRPVEWCDAHHIQHWSRGGATALDNLVLLCRPHHTEVHLRDLTLVRDGNTLKVAPPRDGKDPPEEDPSGRT